MKYIVKVEFKNEDVYLPKLHQNICPGLLTQAEIKHYIRLGYGYMFEEIKSKKKYDSDSEKSN